MNKIVIIGGGAAGPKVALKAKREHPDFDILLITEEDYTSYSGCGLPYYIGGVINGTESVIIKSPEQLRNEFGLVVFTGCRVEKIEYDNNTVEVKDLIQNKHFSIEYDRLVIATGASPVIPNSLRCKADNLFTLRSVDDGFKIKEYINNNNVHHISIIGGSFIGLELAENIKKLGKQVSVIELSEQLLPSFDRDFGDIIRNIAVENGVNVFTGESATGFEFSEDKKLINRIITNKRTIATDLIVMSVGVSPNTGFIDANKIELNKNNTIIIDKKFKTSCENIYAVGDCTENYNLNTNKKSWLPMGSTANKAGRVCGINISNENCSIEFPGVAGTIIFKLFSIGVGKTGLSEKDAINEDIDYECVTIGARNVPKHFPGSDYDVLKLIARKSDRKIIGLQAFGKGPIDKYVDTIVTAMKFGATVEDLQYLDLSYSPLFGTPISAINLSANVLGNKMNGLFNTISVKELHQIMNNSDIHIIDVRSEDEYALGHIPNSINVDYLELIKQGETIDKNSQICLICDSVKRAYIALRYLEFYGYTDVTVLDGGLLMWPYQKVSLY